MSQTHGSPQPLQGQFSLALVIGLIGTLGATVYYYRQQGTQEQEILRSADLQDSYKDHISSFKSQIDALNSQIAQLQDLNEQLGGNNAQLTSQIQQLQAQVDDLQAQLSELNQILNLQQSQVIASQVTIDRQSATVPSGLPTALVGIGTIQYSGYLRVTWNSPARSNFGIRVFDVNVTTPFTTAGIYSVPVSGNAIGNAWFQCLDYYFVNGVNVCIDDVTYSITYWY